MKIFDETLKWQGFGRAQFEHGKWESFCRLRIYGGDTGAVVVVSDIHDAKRFPEGTGTSITNAAENICRIVVERHKLDPQGFVWLEHYPCAGGKETFARVAFDYVPGVPAGVTFQHPQWSHLTRAQVVELTNDPTL